MDKKNKKKQLIGEVISNKMDKSIVIKVVRRITHPIYRKYINQSKKYYAHDSNNTCNIGDIVTIEECRPLSKLKRWRVKEIQQKAIN